MASLATSLYYIEDFRNIISDTIDMAHRGVENGNKQIDHENVAEQVENAIQQRKHPGPVRAARRELKRTNARTLCLHVVQEAVAHDGKVWPGSTVSGWCNAFTSSHLYTTVTAARKSNSCAGH